MTTTHNPDRYGSGSGNASGKVLAVLLGTLGVLLIAGIAWTAYNQYLRSDLSSLVTGYRTVSSAANPNGLAEADDSTLEVRFSVTRKDPSRPAVCLVRGMSNDKAELGRREVLIEPSQNKTVDLTTTLRTSGRASTGDLYGCGWDVPEYLVPAEKQATK